MMVYHTLACVLCGWSRRGLGGWYMIESHLISWHVGIFHGRNYILHGMIVVSVRPLHVHLGGE